MTPSSICTLSSELVSQRLYDAVFNSLDVRTVTVVDYKYRIKHFYVFIQKEGVDYNLLLRNKRFLEARENYSISTKNKYLTCATVFLRQCRQLGFVRQEINCHVNFFSQSKKHKKFGISEIEASRVCHWMVMNPDKVRENVILSLLMFQGFRQAEICNIKWSDIRLTERAVFVRGKGQDDKEPVHLHPNTYKLLHSYTTSCPSHDGYILMSKSRKSANNKLTERGLRFIVKGVLEELGIDKDVHGFRHYFTTHLIRMMPGELTKVAQFTRHRSLEMLQVYNDGVADEEDNLLFDVAFKPL
jgi:integrase/recombinase XerC